MSLMNFGSTTPQSCSVNWFPEAREWWSTQVSEDEEWLSASFPEWLVDTSLVGFVDTIQYHIYIYMCVCMCKNIYTHLSYICMPRYSIVSLI